MTKLTILAILGAAIYFLVLKPETVTQAASSHQAQTNKLKAEATARAKHVKEESKTFVASVVDTLVDGVGGVTH